MWYLVAVVQNPTNKDVEDTDAEPTIVVQPTLVCAKTKDAAILKAGSLAGKDLPRLEVLVVPFGK